jgi:hypothetical protein
MVKTSASDALEKALKLSNQGGSPTANRETLLKQFTMIPFSVRGSTK